MRREESTTTRVRAGCCAKISGFRASHGTAAAPAPPATARSSNRRLDIVAIEPAPPLVVYCAMSQHSKRPHRVQAYITP